MTRLRLVAAALALAATILAPTPAAACSVRGDYRAPTGLELSVRADLILLGIVEGEADPENAFPIGDVLVRPTLLLKGDALPAEVRIRGYLSEDPRLAAPSDPRDLLNPHPGTLRGACTRYTFRRGMLLLLFLERDVEGRFNLAPYPFARSAEDVPSPDAPWVRAVRLYVEVAALPEAEREAALIVRRDALRAENGDPDAALIAKDIDRLLLVRQLQPSD